MTNSAKETDLAQRRENAKSAENSPCEPGDSAALREKTLRQSTKRSLPPLWTPLIIGIVLTVFVLLFNLDLQLADLFRTEGGEWVWKGLAFERFIYKVSPVPAFVAFGLGTIVAIGSFWKTTWKRWRRIGLCLSLCMLLGPGLVVNGIFKEFYGRPRPKQTEQYGGKMEFRPVWVVGIPHKAKSFPCGHASIGFFFMAGYFIYFKRNHRTARRWLIFGLLYGALIGYARMARGGHWFSDVVWAAVFIYYTSYLSAWICGLLAPGEEQRAQAH